MITFDNDIYSFDYIGGQTWVYYTTLNPTTNIRVQSSAEWCNVSVEHTEAQEGNLFLVVSTNNGGNRTATCKMTAYDQVERRDISATFVIVQSGNTILGKINIENIKIDGAENQQVVVNSDGHQLSFDAKTTLITALSITNTTEWLSLYSRSQSGDVYSFVYNITPNTSGEERLDNIILTGSDPNGNMVQQTLQVKQGKQEEHPIVFNIGDINVDYRAQTVTLPITSENVTNYAVDEYPIWTHLGTLSPTEVTFNVDENTIYENRKGNIVYLVTGVDGDEIEITRTIEQNHAVIQEEIPAWRDYYLPLTLSGDNKEIYYRVYVSRGGDYEKIFEGHSYAFADETPEVNISEIVRNYIKDEIKYGALNSLQKSNLTSVSLYSSADFVEFGKIADLTYYYDYSFVNDDDQDYWYNRNYPIFDYVDPRQSLPISVMNHSSETNTLIVDNFSKTVNEQGIFTVFKTITNDYMNVSYAGEHRQYKKKDTCAKYVLYYLNQFGGWDSLLFEGKCVKNVAYEKNTILHDFNNTKLDFGNEHYLKNIKTTYKCTTNYMSDEQSKRMPSVLQTTKAYLQDLSNGKIVPVLVNNANTDIKSYRNNNRKLFTYTIELEESQNKFTK